MVIRDQSCTKRGEKLRHFKGKNYYGKDTEPLYHYLMYLLVSLLSGIYCTEPPEQGVC